MTTVEELIVRLFHPPRLLIVQDSAAPVEALLHRNYDCHVDSTASGEEALKLLATQPYDLIMVDLALMNGTGKKVLQAAQRKNVRVVVTRFDPADLSGMENTEAVTLLTAPLTLSSIERLFRVFKLKAKTHEITQCCDNLMRSGMV